MSQKKQVQVSPDELLRQHEFIALCQKEISKRHGKDATPLCHLHSFGCQQNVSDGEKIMGMLCEMGYGFTSDPNAADLVIYNTCAVRENAESKVFGIVGELSHCKARNENLLVGLCGCMAQQEHIAEKVKKSYPQVDFLFGTHALHRFPEIFHGVLQKDGEKRRRIFDITPSDGVIAEGIPLRRESAFQASLPIMYGCNNFCTYCVVPLVRGRERSRRSADILKEARELIAAGYKEITLLGQNVNSYGKDLEHDLSFPELLEAINALPGDFWIRFMTSHPRDCTPALIDAIARSVKVCRHIHLPVQSGSDRILKEMNRHYNAADYQKILRYAKEKLPDAVFTSDIIVGFPGEQYADFLETVRLVEEMGYSSLFTFIYSKRSGTKAAEMDDPIPYSEKSTWFRELLAAQKKVGMRYYDACVGKTLRVLVEGHGKEKGGILSPNTPTETVLMGRTSGNMVVDFVAPEALIGTFTDVTITNAANWALAGVWAYREN